MGICSEQAALASPKMETQEQFLGRDIPWIGVGQVREISERVPLRSRGLERPAAANPPVHEEAKDAGLSHCSWGNPSLLRTSDAKVLILFFRVSVSRSKACGLETFINLAPGAHGETESNVVSVLSDGAELRASGTLSFTFLLGSYLTNLADGYKCS